MNEIEAIAILVTLLALWCIAPLTILFTIGYVMKHLLDRWQAQDEKLVEPTASIASN
jgi:hypothetical protein